MSKAGLEPDLNSTRGIHLFLMSEKSSSEKAWETLEDMHEDGHPIPIAAVNVILETLCRQKNTDEALKMYKKVYTLCKANTETFNCLLKRMGTKDMPQAKSIAMFLAAEMHALGVKPDRVTYDRLIIICAQQQDYEDAFRYWEEMKQVGKARMGKEWELRTGTLEMLIKRCVRAGDARSWRLIKLLGERGVDTTQTLWWAEKKWKVEERTDTEEWPQLRTNTLDFS
jgi:pentatricopeptide repeat protein